MRKTKKITTITQRPFIPLFFSLFIFSLPFNLAPAVTLEKRAEGQFFITASNCAEVDSEATNFRNWKSRVEGTGSCRITKGKFESSGQCSVKITDCLPDHVKKYQGVHPDVQGPNCYNLALVMMGLNPVLRFAHEDEKDFYLKPPFCRLLSSGEQPRAGDMGYLSGESKELDHAFIYISENLAYSKGSNEKTSPYGVRPLCEIFNEFPGNQRGDNCKSRDQGLQKGQSQGQQNGQPQEPSKGTLQGRRNQTASRGDLSFYRCLTLDDFLKETKNGLKGLDQQLKNLEKIECEISGSLFGGGVLTQNASESISQGLAGLNEYLKSHGDQYQTENEKIAYGVLYFRLMSLLEQTEYKSSLFERLKGAFKGRYQRLIGKKEPLDNEQERISKVYKELEQSWLAVQEKMH